MKRHHVILGTQTTAGGEVISAGSTRSLNGVKFALEGDQIYCPACKSTGVIRCHGPRLPDTWNGINFALEHDLCICGCKTPPTLLAGQFLSSQTVDGVGNESGETIAGKHALNADGERASVKAPAPQDPYDEQPQFVAPPIEGVPYHIETPDGRTFSGRTGSDGLLPRIDTSGEDEYAVYWGDEAIAKTTGADA